jgi:hypothetical protein
MSPGHTRRHHPADGVYPAAKRRRGYHTVAASHLRSHWGGNDVESELLSKLPGWLGAGAMHSALALSLLAAGLGGVRTPDLQELFPDGLGV